MVSKISEDELNEIKETFTLFDTRGDEKIAACQLGDVLRALSQNPTEQEIRKCGFSQNPGIYAPTLKETPQINRFLRRAFRRAVGLFFVLNKMNLRRNTHGDNVLYARISFETFFPILQTISKNRILPSMEDFVEGFRVFDKDQNGTIASAELRHILTSLGEKLTEEEVDQLLSGQEDSQGNIQYEEFIRLVMNG